MFIVTGGGSGIGRALALSLACRNQSVLIVGRRENLLQETAASSTLIRYFCADLSNQESVKSFVNYCQQFPRIQGLVNNAGILEPITLLKDILIADWQQTFNTNVNTVLFLTQQLYKQLTHGRVLNIGSGAAYFPIKGWSAYCVSKAALSMLTRCWQLESESIDFANVMPGIIDTQMQATARSDNNIDKERIDFYRRLKEHNRLISPETVAAFLTWLLLDVDAKTFSAQEWDIYEQSHHKEWLKPPHQVLDWNF